MGMVQAPQDSYFGHKVVFKLLVQLVNVDRLDGDRSAFFLYRIVLASRYATWDGYRDGPTM